MTATLMGQADTRLILDKVFDESRKVGLYFNVTDASVIRVGSDHGADFYVITGLVEANRFDTFVGYLEWADNARLSFMQVPENGDWPWARTPIEWAVN
jgi:hypothetical protein